MARGNARRAGRRTAYFDVAYTGDVDPADTSAQPPKWTPAPAAVLVRGRASPVTCAAAPMCSVQCAGVQQYAEWLAACANGTYAPEPWVDDCGGGSGRSLLGVTLGVTPPLRFP